MIQSTEGLNRTKKWRKGKFALYLSWDIHLLLSLDISTPGSQAFRVRLNYITSFPSSPACGWQIWGILAFHNPVSQFL